MALDPLQTKHTGKNDNLTITMAGCINIEPRQEDITKMS